MAGSPQAGSDGADLAGQHQLPPVVVQVQRFDAEPVAAIDQIAACLLQQHQRPHAIATREQPLAPCAPAMQDDLGIAVGAELMTQPFQFAAQLKKVVDLAIEHQHVAGLGAAHWLGRSSAQVQDRQATVA